MTGRDEIEGAPPLAAGYLYRVRADWAGGLIVELRRERRLFGRWLVGTTWVAEAYACDVDTRSVEGARVLAAQWAYAKAVSADHARGRGWVS